MTYQSFPKEITDAFYRGEHCFHHCPSIANGSSTDYAIETNYMRFEKSSMVFQVKAKIKNWLMNGHCAKLELFHFYRIYNPCKKQEGIFL